MFDRRESIGRGVVPRLLIAGAGGATLMYLLDPRLGRARRAGLQDQMSGWLRRRARGAGRKAEHARGRLEGLRHVGSAGRMPENDAVLTAKVESEVLTRWTYPKGQISVNSVDGVVELRGTCDTSEQINDLEQQVRKVTGVIDVHNHLHLPKTPAPNKQDALRAR